MTPTFLALLLACGTASTPDHHDHDGDHAHEAPAPAPSGGPLEAPLGSHTARLEPSAEALKLVVLDADGTPVSAEGEARVMLTGTGQEAQMVVLTADGEAWTGPAKAAGAPGYTAVVSVSVDGHQESARLTWGEVPEAHPHGDHDHGDDHDH